MSEVRRRAQVKRSVRPPLGHGLKPMQRPDFPMFVVHFTKDAVPISASKYPAETKDFASLDTKGRLMRIMAEKRVRAT